MSMTFSRSINALLLLVLAVPLLAAGNVDKLIAGLDHPLWSARRDAAERLAATGSDGREAVPGLVESLQDLEPEVRRASARALGAVGRGSAEAVSSLVEALRDEDWVVVVRLRSLCRPFNRLQGRPCRRYAIPWSTDHQRPERRQRKRFPALRLPAWRPCQN